MHRLLEKLSPSARQRVLEGLTGSFAEAAVRMNGHVNVELRQESQENPFAAMVAKS